MKGTEDQSINVSVTIMGIKKDGDYADVRAEVLAIQDEFSSRGLSVSVSTFWTDDTREEEEEKVYGDDWQLGN